MTFRYLLGKIPMDLLFDLPVPCSRPSKVLKINSRQYSCLYIWNKLSTTASVQLDQPICFLVILRSLELRKRLRSVVQSGTRKRKKRGKTVWMCCAVYKRNVHRENMGRVCSTLSGGLGTLVKKCLKCPWTTQKPSEVFLYIYFMFFTCGNVLWQSCLCW